MVGDEGFGDIGAEDYLAFEGKWQWHRWREDGISAGRYCERYMALETGRWGSDGRGCVGGARSGKEPVISQVDGREEPEVGDR